MEIRSNQSFLVCFVSSSTYSEDRILFVSNRPANPREASLHPSTAQKGVSVGVLLDVLVRRETNRGMYILHCLDLPIAEE
jgi:hypothetical protein